MWIGEDLMEGLDKLLAQMGSLADLRPDLMSIMDRAGKFIADDARLRVPVDTGDLRKSIQHTTRDTGDAVETVVHTNSDHAAAVEFGTGPVGAAHHEGISPHVHPQYRQDKWLGVIPELKTETDPGIRYIAGQPAQPYLYPALKDNEEQLQEQLKKEIAKAIRRKLHG